MNYNLLSLYHIFINVAETGSISNAAQKLYISQPAVSKAMQRLEEELGVRLLIRNSHGVVLTEYGQTLYDYVTCAFDSISAGENALFHMKNLDIGHIRIGISSTLCKHILLPKLNGFLKLHPHTQITIDCQSSAHTIELLESHELDLGLIAEPNTKNLLTRPAGVLRDTFVAAPLYIKNLMERENISSSELLTHSNLILLDKQNMTRNYVDTYLNKWKIPTVNAMEVNSMDLLIDFVKTGLGAGCVIKEFVENELSNGQLIELELPDSIPERTISYAYTKSSYNSSSIKSFLEYIG